MSEGDRPQYKTFQLYGDIPRWKVAIAVVVLFSAGWYGWSVASRAIALRNIPRIDFVGKGGVIEQDTTYTCVPAAMAMFLRDEGIETTQYEIAVLAGTDLSGTSDRGIKKALEYFGYTMVIKRMDFWEIHKYGKPLILMERHEGVLHVSYIRPYEHPDIKALEVLDPIDGYLIFGSKEFYEYYGKQGSKKKCVLIEKKQLGD
jgi:hypothetical protein